jgi:hypothetical protein
VCRVGCVISSATTTCPGFAHAPTLRPSGAISRSWLIRRVLGDEEPHAAVLVHAADDALFARSSTSTIVPSGARACRCRRSAR